MPLGGLDANNWRELLGEAHRRHLTPNEQTVIAKVALGHTVAEIAAAEGVSQGTVRGWLRTAGERVYDPLGVMWTHGLLGLWYGAGLDTCCCSEAAL
ncbi:MAG: helix-turn-helix domain-containing protein [Tepidiformaceae bacterium]